MTKWFRTFVVALAMVMAVGVMGCASEGGNAGGNEAGAENAQPTSGDDNNE